MKISTLTNEVENGVQKLTFMKNWHQIEHWDWEGKQESLNCSETTGHLHRKKKKEGHLIWFHSMWKKEFQMNEGFNWEIKFKVFEENVGKYLSQIWEWIWELKKDSTFCVLSRQGTKTTNAGRNIANVDLAKMSNFKRKIKIRWVAGEMGIYFFIMFYQTYMIKILLSESNIRLKTKSGNRE